MNDKITDSSNLPPKVQISSGKEEASSEPSYTKEKALLGKTTDNLQGKEGRQNDENQNGLKQTLDTGDLRENVYGQKDAEHMDLKGAGEIQHEKSVNIQTKENGISNIQTTKNVHSEAKDNSKIHKMEGKDEKNVDNKKSKFESGKETDQTESGGTDAATKTTARTVDTQVKTKALGHERKEHLETSKIEEGTAKTIPPEILKVLTGLCPFDELPPLPKKVVRIFVSSTFTGKL